MKIFEIIYFTRGVIYLLDDYQHREDGPATLWNNKSYSYFKYGKRHNINGPARFSFSEMDEQFITEWFVEGKILDCSTQEEFERIVKLLHFQ